MAYYEFQFNLAHSSQSKIKINRLEKMIEWNNLMFEMYDFKIVDGPVNLLPGVDLETKKIDGSVRHYTEWEITRSATDSTEAKTAKLKMYSAYVFNEGY